MNLSGKTKKWVDHQLITEDQQKAILAHEDKQFLPFVLTGILWLGLFSVGLGLVSLIAAHWTTLPEWSKLLGLVVFLSGGIGTAVYAFKKEKHLIAETALFFSFLMVGGGIGLVAQIFNLPINGAGGLLLWALLSLGIVLISRRDFLLFLWIPLFVGGIIGFMKLELLLLFFEQSPVFATALLATILLGIIYLSHFFENRWMKSAYKWAIALYFPVIFFGDVALHTSISGFLLSFSFLLLLTAFAIKEKRIRLFHITSFFMAARLIILYFQLFDNLIVTGIGFLVFGLLLLVLIGGWYVLEKKMKKISLIDSSN